jgi:hypothetical protein
VCVRIDRRLLFVVVVLLQKERPSSRNAHKVDLDLTCRRLSLLHLQYGVAGSECSKESKQCMHSRDRVPMKYVCKRCGHLMI